VKIGLSLKPNRHKHIYGVWRAARGWRASDRPQFCSVPVPAEIATKISVPVSVLAKFGILVLAGNTVQK